MVFLGRPVRLAHCVAKNGHGPGLPWRLVYLSGPFSISSWTEIGALMSGGGRRMAGHGAGSTSESLKPLAV